MSILVINAEDLERQLQKVVDEVKSAVTNNDSSNIRWIRSKQVKELLGISDSKLQTMRINRSITYSQIDGTYFYDKESILSLLEQNKVLCEHCV
jgi:Ser-tRNA(Ala) deacylase AlaX